MARPRRSFSLEFMLLVVLRIALVEHLCLAAEAGYLVHPIDRCQRLS